MNRDLIFGGLAGATSALLVMAAASGPFGLVLGYLALLPLFFAGLTRGLGAAAAAAAGGMLVSGIYGFMSVVMFALLFGLPVVWLVRQALLARPAEEAGQGADVVNGLEWYPAGGLLLHLLAITTGLLIAVWVATSTQPGGLVGVLQPLLAQFFSALPPEAIGTGTPGDLAERAARIMPGVTAVSWMTMVTVNAVLAQGLAVMVKQNRRPSPRYSAVTLPRVLVLALPAAVAVSVLMPAEMKPFGFAAVALVGYALFLQGLAVIHVLVAKAPASGLVLAAFYVALVVASALVAILVVLLGFIEEWAGFRRRVAGAGTSRESD